MTPRISVIIVSYNMAREIPRTVLSFLPPYQRGLDAGEVEVLVLENGSPDPVPAEIRRSWPSSVRYIEVPNPSPSPARALNLGARMARGAWLCPVIDGARMASPGLLAKGLEAASRWSNPFIASLGLHLGPKLQPHAVLEGYNQKAEDALIARIAWPEDGYRLFEIAALAGSAQGAWFSVVAESNAPILSAALYHDLRGFDLAFDFPGGGLVNLDFLNRAIDRSDVDYMMVLGEATFHQFHGGVTTSRSVAEVEADGRTTWARYAEQYASIRGRPYQTPERRPRLYGDLPDPAVRIAAAGLAEMQRRWSLTT